MLQDRTSEWFVPKFGSRNFRVTIGLLFLPYTSIVTCFAAWGSLSGSFETERLIAVCVIYFLALGVSAHLLDAVGGKTKPWGDLPKRKTLDSVNDCAGNCIYNWNVLRLLGFSSAVCDRNCGRVLPVCIQFGIVRGKVPQQLVNNNCMGHTADFCRLCNSDKLNIAGSNHTLWNFFSHNLHFDNNLKKV